MCNDQAVLSGRCYLSLLIQIGVSFELLTKFVLQVSDELLLTFQHRLARKLFWALHLSYMNGGCNMQQFHWLTRAAML